MELLFAAMQVMLVMKMFISCLFICWSFYKIQKIYKIKHILGAIWAGDGPNIPEMAEMNSSLHLKMKAQTLALFRFWGEICFFYLQGEKYFFFPKVP